MTHAKLLQDIPIICERDFFVWKTPFFFESLPYDVYYIDVFGQSCKKVADDDWNNMGDFPEVKVDGKDLEDDIASRGAGISEMALRGPWGESARRGLHKPGYPSEYDDYRWQRARDGASIKRATDKSLDHWLTRKGIKTAEELEGLLPTTLHARAAELLGAPVKESFDISALL